jgi:hypothetical protein
MRTRPKRTFLILATVAAAALALYCVARVRRASADGSLPELLALAPADSRFLVYADVRALRDSPLVQRLAAMAPPAKMDSDYKDFVSATGFDYQRDLDRVVIAEQPNGPSGQTLSFAEGRFNREKIAQYALRSGKSEREGSREIYSVPSATPGKTISIAFLAADRIALADGGDLAAALAAPTVASDPALRLRISRVAGAPLFAIVKAPAAAGNGATTGGGLAAFTSSFQSLRWVSFAARPDGDGLLLSAEGECDTPVQAQSVATGIEILRGLLRSALTAPKTRGQMSPASAGATDQFLGAAKVSTDAARVRLLLTVTPEMLRAPEASGSGRVLPPGH